MPHLVGQGPIAQVGPTSVGIPHTSPPPMQLGSCALDADGNEYILCQAGEPVFSEQPVTISANFTVAALATTGRGQVGICQAGASSDELVWVMIYGLCFVQLGMGGVSPSDAANGPTTLNTSVATRFILATSLSTPPALGWVSDQSSLAEQFYIDDIFVATDADLTAVSATTAATSHTGSRIRVWINRPSIRHVNYGA